ncbi:MAG TPA: autotransporter-associated beta strand repeat-containing protein, partial [Verrucomicrobiae bacterium]|nr:autotransporter-associated beta strand repeat-containing protein [Verrucomicrobiae bacterium]
MVAGACLSAAGAFASYQTITNDVWWKDNNGNPVMAQGGGISKFGGTYYWYGVQYVEMGPYYTNGTVNTGSSTFSSINCYNSTDLVHWTFVNKSVSRSTAGFSSAGWVGRLGQVVYNSASGKYVMWFEGLNGQACCTSTTPGGNFVLDHVQPAITNVYSGPGAGDCTIFCDVDHGSTPYFICSDPHGRQHAYVCPLSSNFLTIGNAVAINDTGSIPAWPQGQEASNMFERNGIYYYTMSNLAGWSYSTAYEVNSTSIFSPTSYTADAAYLGTTADNTHYSQVSFGFQVAGTVTTNYLMVGDRWAQFISTYASAGHGSNFAVMCPITFTNNTPYFQSLNMFQIDAVTGKWRPATTADSPTNLTATAGSAQATLNWAAMDGADAYNVKRSTVNGGPYSIIASPTANNFTDNTAANGTTYYYVISSTNVFGDSLNSAQVNVTPSIGPLITTAGASPNLAYPGQPVIISATVIAQANPIAAVTVDASAIGGLPNQTLVADGAGNFTNTVIVGATTPVAVLTLTANASDTLGNIASPYSFLLTIGTVNVTWNGNGPDNNWSDTSNWATGSAPGFGYSLIFAGVKRPTPVMDASNNIYAVTFDGTASSFFMTASGGSALTLTGGVTNSSPNSQTLSVPVILGAPVTINAATAAVTLGQTINNNGNLLTIADGGRNTLLGGVISGTGGLAKYGTGTNSLYANNTFSGGIVISNGTLIVGSIPTGSSGQLGAGAYSGAIVDNGTLTFNSGASQNLSGVISGMGALNQTGSASLTLSAANTFTGPTTLAAGTLLLSNPLALQNSTLNFIGGKINPTGLSALTLGGLSGTQGTVLINNSLAGVALTVGGNGSNTVYSGALSGSGVSLTKTGTGTTTLTGSNSYTGSTTVNTGTLELPSGGINGGALAGAGFLVDGGTLISSDGTALSALNNAFTESSGTATLGAITEPNADGLLIKITGGNFSATSLTLQRTAQFLTAPTATIPITAATTSGLYVNGGTANVNLGTLTIGTGNSSDSVRLDAGNLTVTNEVLVGRTSNTRWEILHINGGSFTSLDTFNGIVLSQNNGATANNSEVYLSGGTTTAGKIAFGTVTDTVGGTGFLIVTNAFLYVGSGGIVQPNTTGYVSTISLLGGTLGAAADWSSTLPMQLNGTTFIFQTSDASGVAHNISLSGSLSGAGKLAKTGLGMLTLLATNTYTGGTTVNAGKLLVNGAVAVNGGVLGGTGVISGPVTVNGGGTLTPGNPLGTLTISNNLVLAGGTLSAQVQHSPATNSVVKISGSFTN